MSITILVPRCPWCGESMEYLAESSDQTTHVEPCRACQGMVEVSSSLVLQISAACAGDLSLKERIRA